MIVKVAKGPIIALGLVSAAVIVGGAVAAADGPAYLWAELGVVVLVLLLRYLYLSRRALELRLDEIIDRTLFKTIRIHLRDLASIQYEPMAPRRSRIALVLRAKPSNRPVAVLSPREFRRDEWTRFVAELHRRSGLPLNVSAPDEIPNPPRQRARPLDLFFVLVFLGGGLLFYQLSDDYPYLELLPAPTVLLFAAVFVVTLVVAGAARDRLAALGDSSEGYWSEGPRIEGRVVVWLGVIGLAVFTAIGVVGAVHFANGAFDRTPPHYMRFVVTRRRQMDGYFLEARPDSTTNIESKGYDIHVTWDDWDASARGDIILVDVRPGFLHLPWVAGYRTCGDSQCL